MKKIIAIVIVLIIIVLGFYLLSKDSGVKTVLPDSTLPQRAQTDTTSVTIANTTTTDVEKTNEIKKATNIHVVNYTDRGYEPGEIIVNKGETVKFKNESSRGMWTASALHPSHAAYDGTSLSEHCGNPGSTTFDECGSAQPGQEWSFTFNKEGSWKYHNHVNPGDFGSVTVK